MTPDRSPWPWWRWALTGLSVLALALSAFLAWHYLTGGSIIGCGGGTPCDEILNSRWSAVAGVVPVSGLAAGAYLAMLAASFFVGPATDAPVRRLAWSAMLVLSGAAAGSAVWFTVVQKWFIGAFCPYCMATHITGMLLAAVIFWRALREFADASIETALNVPAKSPNIGTALPCDRANAPLHSKSLALTGLALAGILAACQAAFAPRAVYRSGESLQDNLTSIDPHTVPLVGSPDAPFVVALLFDYKCPHCQQLHFLLDEAIRRYSGKLAFALCPAPLNTHCNPYIPRDVDEFADSCELAKLALAVWVARREAFPAFDRWMFSLESGDRWHPRSLESARAEAVELVGLANLNAAQASPWINRYLQTSVQIYAQTGARAVPKLVFGSHWVTPQPNDADDLVFILHDSLAVPNP